MFNSAITLSFYVDVFPEDLEEAAEMIAERWFNPYKEISEGKRSSYINC